jgi:DeoR/GlpR family transcriptional regulator of sugar metabolism
MQFMIRQGDVLVVSIDSIPTNAALVARENGRVILAHGEVTGHAHAIKDRAATLFMDLKLNKIFLGVGGSAPVSLAHDEHGTIDIPPGNYCVIRQREYSPNAIRNVAD